MADHAKGKKKKRFCTVRKKKCQDGNEYQAVCDPGASWQAFLYKHGRTKKYFEAHHILCVSCVTDFIGKDPKIRPVVKQTQWCINAKRNMIALPMWGNTIKYYVDMDSVGIKGAGRVVFDLVARRAGPPFADLPQHDYDHNSKTGYTNEINKDMEKVASQIEKAKDNHKDPSGALAGKLNGLSSAWRSTLRARGRRLGGTHAGWTKGKKNPTSNWYRPFSMAATGSEQPRPFPASGTGDLADRIAQLAGLL